MGGNRNPVLLQAQRVLNVTAVLWGLPLHAAHVRRVQLQDDSA